MHEASGGRHGAAEYCAEMIGLTLAKARWMLKARTSVANGAFGRDHAVAERWAHQLFRRVA
jgi:hypothetical protein